MHDITCMCKLLCCAITEIAPDYCVGLHQTSAMILMKTVSMRMKLEIDHNHTLYVYVYVCVCVTVTQTVTHRQTSIAVILLMIMRRPVYASITSITANHVTIQGMT